MSDVFVVPNLNVAYETWIDVNWDKDACQVCLVLDKDGAMVLPTRISFSIVPKDNKPALSFYSRYHLLDLKLPELKAT